jgi:glutathione reductase (NADPH)
VTVGVVPQIYNSGFVNLYYGTFLEGEAGDKPVSKYKLICSGPEERVVGIHLIGEWPCG